MKKIMSLIAITAIVVGCSPSREVVEIIKGDDGAPGIDGSNGESCYIEESEEGLVLTCGENTYFVSNGQDGNDGTNGSDGTSCSVTSVDNGAEITCGENTVLVSNGTSETSVSSSATSVGSSCVEIEGLAGYSAKKSGSGNGASVKVYDDAVCGNEITSLSSTNELHVLNLNTILLYQSSGNNLVVLKVGN